MSDIDSRGLGGGEDMKDWSSSCSKTASQGGSRWQIQTSDSICEEVENSNVHITPLWRWTMNVDYRLQKLSEVFICFKKLTLIRLAFQKTWRECAHHFIIHETRVVARGQRAILQTMMVTNLMKCSFLLSCLSFFYIPLPLDVSVCVSMTNSLVPVVQFSNIDMDLLASLPP